jgi:fatty-acyl-CoA synthase
VTVRTVAGSILRRQTLGDLLRRSAARFPGKPAIACGGVTWTYAELDDICTRVATGLARHGIGTGDRVAILSRNSHGFAALRFALARLGAVLVPINFMLKAAEAAYILRHAEVRLLCVDDEFTELGRQTAGMDTRVEELLWLPGEASTTGPPELKSFQSLLIDGDARSPADVSSGSLAQIIYTSGTEALPKGAMLTHDAVIWQYVSCVVDAGIASDDVMLHALPFYHCAQLDAFLGPAVYVGASNIITSRPVPESLLALIEQCRITSFFAPPTVWIAMLRSHQFDTRDLSTLRKGYYGASPMPVEVLRELQRRLPQVRFWNLYGQTEIAPVATVLKPEDQLRKAGSAGRAVLNVETRVVDELGNDVPVGQVGEIVHRSPQLLAGYYHDDARTSESFAGGWFHSGDLATIDEEGYITVVDRKKDMIKSGGENVASREVEEMIYRIAGVAEVAVVGVPHPLWVEAVTAVVVVKDGHAVSEQQIIGHCRASMAGFKVPKRVVFVEALPKNPSGKLLKRELRERYASSGTSPAGPTMGSEAV